MTPQSDVLDRPSPGADPSAQQQQRQRPGSVFLLVSAAVIVAAVAVRLMFLGQQSYWVDELFSVHASAGSLDRLLTIGATEVHPPLYTMLLWLWMKVGTLNEAWTRSLSTLFAVAAVAVAYWGLRPVRLDSHVRWALVVATAASGTSIVYSLDTRSYALMVLGATGVTAATVRAAITILDREPLTRRVRAVWFSWALLAATTHLFGAALALASWAVLVTLTALDRKGSTVRARVRAVVSWSALAAAACSLQAGWILNGLNQPGFAADTDWIEPPGKRDVWELATTTFSSGRLTTQKDGFAWASPVGVFATVALFLVAAGFGLWATRRSSRPAPDPADAPASASAQAARDTRGTAEGQAAGVLIVLAALVIVPTWVVSQVEHLWTLRNLAVISPALLWGAICLAAAAARTRAGHRAVATTVVLLLGAGLVPMAQNLSQPYKQDYRALFAYLREARAEQPNVQIMFTGREPAWGWQQSTDPNRDDPAYHLLYRDVGVQEIRTRDLTRTGGPQIAVRYPGVAPIRFDEQVRTMMIRLDPAECRPVPIYDLVVVRCR